MSSLRLSARKLALACVLVSAAQAASAAPADYRFTLVGKPVASGGRDIVHVRLIHIPDGKPVAGAVIFGTTADMGPEGMATMTGPVRAMPPHGPQQDTDYAFEIEPGMSGNWALHLSAKVQGEAGTVTGTLTAALVK